MFTQEHKTGYLEGQLLIATPLVVGSCFAHAVIFMCAHNEEGAMGLVINHTIEDLSYKDIFRQLKIELGAVDNAQPVHFGGPVDTARGFVLHSPEFARRETVVMAEDIALTSNVDILKEMAIGRGPREFLLALGYAGWGPGQLEIELEGNSWISAPASSEILFNVPNAEKWGKAASSVGVDLLKLSPASDTRNPAARSH